MNGKKVGLACLFALVTYAGWAFADIEKPRQTTISAKSATGFKSISSHLILAEATDTAPALGADGFPLPSQKKAMGDAPPPPADVMTPLERVNSTPKGQLKNPYKDDAEMPKWGQKRFMGNSCNGCHGGTGGGGMCPPLSNETWVYGSDDDTLFRLITLGSDELQKQGYVRKGRENVVGPMPAFGGIIKTDDELWRIISFIRTTYRGDASRKDW